MYSKPRRLSGDAPSNPPNNGWTGSSNDGAQVQTSVGKYKPNAFGLCDMIGNVAEWTSSSYGAIDQKVSRGGSWRDLPRWTPVSRRVPYQAHQRVYNVGIRVVMDD